MSSTKSQKEYHIYRCPRVTLRRPQPVASLTEWKQPKGSEQSWGEEQKGTWQRKNSSYFYSTIKHKLYRCVWLHSEYVNLQVVRGDLWRILGANICSETSQFVTGAVSSNVLSALDRIRLDKNAAPDRRSQCFSSEKTEGWRPWQEWVGEKSKESYLRTQSQRTSMSEQWETQSCTCFLSLILISLSLQSPLCFFFFLFFSR